MTPGTGNKGDGIRVDGSNGPMSENVSKANTLVGIRVTGTGHELKKNKSGGTGNQNNGSCQYVVGASNANGGSNTSSNNATFTFDQCRREFAGGLRAGTADTVAGTRNMMAEGAAGLPPLR